MNYTEARETLSGRKSRKVDNNTYLQDNGGSVGLRLHDTQVVMFYPNYAQLYTGGWYTPTTKDRINNYAPCQIVQHNNIWYISEDWEIKDKPLFYEGIKVDYTGKIVGKIMASKAVEDKNAKIKAKIKKYIDLAMVKLSKGIELPNGGDCWYCSFKVSEGKDTGKSWGDVASSDHLLQHFKDGYIVPSLLWNAVKEAGYQYPEVILGYDPETKKMGSKHMGEWSVKTSLKKYLQKRLLIKP